MIALADPVSGSSSSGDIIVPVFQSTGAMILWLVVTVLMPILVGLVTKPATPPQVKSLLLLVLSFANGLLSEALAAGDGFNWGKAIMQTVVAFVIAGASYARVWNPLGVTAAVQQIGAPPAGTPARPLREPYREE